MGRRGSMRALAVGMTVVGLAGVSGCGGSSTATHGTSSSSSPSVTSTPAVSSPSSVKTSGTPGSSTTSQAVAATSNATLAGAPGVPEPARHKSKDGAIAFARYYIAQINETGIHPKKGVLEPLALDSCKTCDNFENTVMAYLDDGEELAGPTLIVKSANHVVALDKKTVNNGVEVICDQPAVAVHGPSPSMMSALSQTGLVFSLTWTPGGWRVDGIYVDNAI